MEQASAVEAGPSGDATMRAEGERIEQLLAELQGMSGPQVWQRIEELMQRVVGLYGVAMERLLLAASNTRDVHDLQDRVRADELLSAVLLLHGLHPMVTEQRVRSTLADLEPALAAEGWRVELLKLDETPAVTLRILEVRTGCGGGRGTVERALIRALEQAAPELTRMEIEGGTPRESAANDLVQIRRPSSNGSGRLP